MKTKLNLFAPGALALEGYHSPEVTYTPTTTTIATEGLVDEIKRTYGKVKTKLSGKVSEKEADATLNDKAVDSLEKGLRYLKTQVSSAKFNNTHTVDVGRALRKLGLGARPGESSSVLSGLTRKLKNLEVALERAKAAGDKASGGHKEEAIKIVSEESKQLAADHAGIKGRAEYTFTKQQVLGMIDEGLKACALYRKTRQITPEKLAHGKKIALEALDDSSITDVVVSGISSVFTFIFHIGIATFKFIGAIYFIALLILNPMMFLFTVAVAAVITALFDYVKSKDEKDD